MKQESFHKHRLRAAMSMRVPLAQMLVDLETFSQSRAIQAAQDVSSLADAPAGTWSKTFREAASVYIGASQYVSDEDSDGNLFLAMREDHKGLEHAQTPLTVQVLQHLKRLILLNEDEQVPLASLLELGGSADRSWAGVDRTLRTLSRWVLTVSGPLAQRQWRVAPADGPQAATHTLARCFLCRQHAVWGGCGHTYVSFRVLGLLEECASLISFHWARHVS